MPEKWETVQDGWWSCGNFFYCIKPFDGVTARVQILKTTCSCGFEPKKKKK